MMIQDFIREKLEALHKDKTFTDKLRVCETAQAICDLYAQEDIEITVRALDAAIESIDAESAEFSETELDDVAGGLFISGPAFLAWSIAYSCVTIQSAYTMAKMTRKRR